MSNDILKELDVNSEYTAILKGKSNLSKEQKQAVMSYKMITNKMARVEALRVTINKENEKLKEMIEDYKQTYNSGEEK